MTFQLAPNFEDTTSYTVHIKRSFTRLLWDLFDAEEDWNFQQVADVEGLHIYTKFPEVYAELPAIVVGLRPLTTTRLSMNKTMGKPYLDRSSYVGDEGVTANHFRDVQGFAVTGMVEFTVMGQTDNERDRLMDRLNRYFMFRKSNIANLDPVTELAKRWIKIDPDHSGTSGDQEMEFGDGTNDLMYLNAMAVSFYAEIFEFEDDAVPLEDIITTLTPTN